MRGKDLLECIEQIDDALVEEAMEPVPFPRRGIDWFRSRNVAKWGMAAACVVVLGVSAAAFWSHQGVRDEQSDQYPMAMNTPADDNTAATESSQDSDLTAGTVEDKAEADGGADAAHEKTAGSGDATVRDRAVTDGSNDAFHKESSLDNSTDTSSQSSVATSVLSEQSTEGAENTAMELAEAESAKLQYTIIGDYYGEKDDAVYDYPLPEKGEIICYHYLQETMEYYAGLERATNETDQPLYAYHIVIDVYGDVAMDGGQEVRYQELNWEDTTARNEMIDQEYMRLEELGYTVQLAEDLRITGTFTKDEIDTFQASPEYGYVFRFADEY